MKIPFSRRRDHDLDDELETHLRLAIRDRVDRGSPRRVWQLRDDALDRGGGELPAQRPGDRRHFARSDRRLIAGADQKVVRLAQLSQARPHGCHDARGRYLLRAPLERLQERHGDAVVRKPRPVLPSSPIPSQRFA